jgi:hypothetical protein
MTGDGPSQQLSASAGPGANPAAVPSSSAADRAARFNAANMLRSLLPLVVIILLIVGWYAFRDGGGDPVRTVDPSSTVQLAASRASYQVVAPAGLAEGYRPTSARTDAGAAKQGDPVTLQIGYLTPSGKFAGFAESDDPRADALTSVLDGARQRGSVEVGGTSWARSTTQRGETALSLRTGSSTVVVSGSATDAELSAVAAAVRPYSP